MKTIYIFLILVFISGCSSKNAFTHFDMDKYEQLSAQSFKRVKLVKGEEVIGTFSSIYLNDVYPERYNKNEYFIVYIYLKNQSMEFDTKLNSNTAVKIRELNNKNRFSNIIRETSSWSKYYLISFNEAKADILNLELYIDGSRSASISYYKNKQ